MLSDDIHVPREYEGFLKAIYALGAELIYKVPYGGALIKYKNLLIKIERDWNNYYLCLGFADKYEEIDLENFSFFNTAALEYICPLVKGTNKFSHEDAEALHSIEVQCKFVLDNLDKLVDLYSVENHKKTESEVRNIRLRAWGWL